MKILMVIRSLGIGGAERQFVEFCTGLKDAGLDVVAVVLGGSAPRGLMDRTPAVAVRELGHSGPLTWPRTVSRLTRVISHVRPDVVYSFLPVSNLMATLVRPFTPRFLHVWGIRAGWMPLENYGPLASLAVTLEKVFSRFADLAIFNSHSGLDYHMAVGYRFHRRAVVPNAIDTVRFCPDPASAKAVRVQHDGAASMRVATIVGRLDPVKGHDLFLGALALVRQQDPRWIGWIVGPGAAAERARLVAVCESLGLVGHVHFFSATDELPAVYSASDVVVLSSVSEGFPNVVCEALACGTAVVATEVGDCALILDGVGRIVPAGDRRALAAAILASSDSAGDVGPQARRSRIVDRYSKSASVSRLVVELDRLRATGRA